MEGIIYPIMHCCLTFSASFISCPSSSTSSHHFSLPPSLSFLHLLLHIPYFTSPLFSSPPLTSPLLPSSHLLLFSPPGPVLASSAVRQGRYRHRYDRLREDLGLLDSSPVKNIQSGYVTVCTSCVLCMYTYVCVFFNVV